MIFDEDRILDSLCSKFVVFAFKYLDNVVTDSKVLKISIKNKRN